MLADKGCFQLAQELRKAMSKKIGDPYKVRDAPENVKEARITAKAFLEMMREKP